MNFEQFSCLLQTLFQEPNVLARKQSEAVYYEYRKLDPSDEFCANMFRAIQEISSLRSFAAVLLRQDIDSCGMSCALCRLSQSQMDKKYILLLLQILTQQCDQTIIQVVAVFLRLRMNADDSYCCNEFSSFIIQAFQHENAEVRSLSVSLIAEFCYVDLKIFKRLGFDALDLLQRALGDSSGKVAGFAVQALCKLIENNAIEDADCDCSTAISKTMVVQIVVAIIQRISTELSQNDVDNSRCMMKWLCDIAEINGYLLEAITPEILNFASAIMSSANIPESIKCQAINLISGAIVENPTKQKKALQEQISQFFQHFVVPNCCTMSESELEPWLTSPVMDDVQDNTLETLCSKLMDSASYTLGKKIVHPLLQYSFVAAAGQPDNWQFQAAVLTAFCQTTEGLHETLKQKDIDNYVKSVVSYFNSPNPKVRFEATNCLAIMSSDLQPQITNNHNFVMKALANIVNDPVLKVAVHSGNAVINFVSGMDYDTTYLYLDQIILMINLYWNMGTMDSRGLSLSLLALICEIADQDDLLPVVTQMIPLVFTAFRELIQVVQTQPDFTKSQNIYIQSILEILSQAASTFPKLFENSSVDIMEGIILIAERSYSKLEHDNFRQSLLAIKALAETYKQEMSCYVQQLFPLFIKIISASHISIGQSVQDEGDLSFNPHVSDQQLVGLALLSEFLKHCPTAFSNNIEELLHSLSVMKSFKEEITLQKLSCLAQLIYCVQMCGFDVQQYHLRIFPLFLQLIQPFSIDNSEQNKHFELSQLKDCADAVTAYVSTYLQFVSQSQDCQYLIQFQEEMNKELLYLISKSDFIFAQDWNDLHGEETLADLDDDELEVEDRQLIEEYDETLQSIGMAYGAFIQQLKDNCLTFFHSCIEPVINQFLSAGLDTQIQIAKTVQGITIMSDVSEHFSAELNKQIIQPLIPKFLSFVQSTNDFSVIQSVFYTLSCYIQNAKDIDLANNTDITQIAVSFLEPAKANGSDDALYAFDNICAYLAFAGLHSQQTSNFWSSLFSQLMQMSVDEREVFRVVQLLISNATLSIFQPLKQQLVATLIVLFFGKFHGNFKKKYDGSDILQQLYSFFCHDKQFAEQIVKSCDNQYVQKNFNQFYS